MKNNYFGGKAINAGGFGCVFKPQLECNNYVKRYDKNGISKLMLLKYANEETKIINTVNNITKNIKNRDKYFLFNDIYPCTNLKPLNNLELKSFDVCKNLNKKGITRKNVNKNLYKLMTINMPYGGMDLDKYWDVWHNIKDIKKKNIIFNAINNKLIDLLTNAINKINDKNFYHTDIKSSNLLIKIENENSKNPNVSIKLIDWGLSELYNNHHVLDNLINKPIQYNIPYGNILFTNETNKAINSSKIFSKKDESDVRNILLNKYDTMKRIIKQIFEKTINNLGTGHLKFIRYMYNKIFRNIISSKEQESFFKNILFNYLTEILFKYSNEKNNFDKNKYFKEVYRKNIDIWGFIMCYIEIPLKYNSPWDYELPSKILEFVFKYCIDKQYSIKPIPINTLISELKSLNNLLIKDKKRNIFETLPYFNITSRANNNAGIRSKNITSKLLSSFKKNKLLKSSSPLPGKLSKKNLKSKKKIKTKKKIKSKKKSIKKLKSNTHLSSNNTFYKSSSGRASSNNIIIKSKVKLPSSNKSSSKKSSSKKSSSKKSSSKKSSSNKSSSNKSSSKKSSSKKSSSNKSSSNKSSSKKSSSLSSNK